jgi:hypothetical protein
VDDLPPQIAAADERTLPQRAIVEALWKSTERLRACYEEGRRREPDLAGQVLVRLSVDPGGRVLVAADAGSTVADPAAVRCVLSALTATTFPPWSGSTVWTVVAVPLPLPGGATPR